MTRQQPVVAISEQSASLGNLYQNWFTRTTDNPDMDLQSLREMYDGWESITAEPEDVTYKSVNINGTPGIWAIPRDSNPDTAIIYAHGGGYSLGSAASHRKLVGHIAKAAQAPALVYDYRLAPEHTHPAQLEDSQTVFDWVVAQGTHPSRIALAGDSAGAALVTMLALQIRDSGTEQPGAVVALSPFYDPDGSGETMEENAKVDLFGGTPEIMQSTIATLLGGGSSHEVPYLRVLDQNLSGLPPFFVSSGGFEVLLDDGRRFVDKARLAGVETEFEVAEGMQHIFHLMAGNAPEADAAIDSIGNFLRKHLHRPE